MTGPTTGLQMGAYIGALLLALLAFLLLLLLRLRISAGHRPQSRPIPAFDQLPEELSRAAENGTRLHFAIGSGRIGGDRTIASLAAIAAIEELADSATAYRSPPIVTVGDSTLLPLVEDALRNAYARRGIPERYNPASVRFIADQPPIYAAGAADAVRHEQVGGNIIIGSLAEEASLVAHAGETKQLAQIGAVDQLGALGALYADVDSLAVGEEMYSGIARLTLLPRHLASLRTQDVLRFLLIGVILLKILGIF